MRNLLKYLAKQVLYYKNKLKFKKYYQNLVDDKTIIFQSMHGKYYNDSPKALFKAMLVDEQFKDYKFYFALNKPNIALDVIDPRITKIKYLSAEYLQVVSSAKYIITSTRLANFIKLKPTQTYIQTWHGTPLKRLGVDIEFTTNKRTSKKDYKFLNKHDSYKIDYFISPSPYASKKFTSAFELTSHTKILEVGYPRNDFLTNYTKQDINNIKQQLLISNDQQVILYAPTWRDDQYTLAGGFVDNPPLDLEQLAKKLPNYIILYRSHYMSSVNKQINNVIDVSNHQDINELLIISDLLITDYSSCFFDYAILKRPIIFYMYDLEQYANQTRGFYFDVEKQLPGPIIKDETKLIRTIKNAKVRANHDKFLAKFCPYEDGNATTRVIAQIFK